MTTLREGLPLLYQQFTALFKKNLLLSWRNKRATCLHLFSSFFFIFLIFCIEESTKASKVASTVHRNVTDPKVLDSLPIPPCEDKFFVKLPCFDFVWSGNQSRRVTDIVSAIMANNPGRPIPTNKVQSFKGPEEVDAWFMSNPLKVQGALHFVERNATVISYGVQTNSSLVTKRGRTEDPMFQFLVPLQIAAEREIARSLIGDLKFSWGFGFKEFPRPAIGKVVTVSAMYLMGPVFFLAFSMFGFVLQLGSLVTEKELKLRQAMTMMGVFDTAYWLSWLTWEGILTFVSSLFLVLFGMMFQFDFFLKNSFFVVFLLFLLFQFNMISLAFALSAFVSKSSSATTVGFLVFLIGFMAQIGLVADFPYTSDISIFVRVIWSFFPPNTFSAGLWLLLNATSAPGSSGISWSERALCEGDAATCVISINKIYIWLVGTFFFWFFLAIYLDNIIPNASGVRKPIYYFLKPSYWTGKVEEGSICSCIGSVPLPEHITPEDQDVLEEETVVKQQAMDGLVDPNIAVHIHGLAKTYPGTTKLGCCKCKKTAPFQAVKGLWLNIAKDQLFCLLGPNGAGKTTTISCMTGINPVASGDAIIYGNSVRSSVGMSNIRKMIGVCPQFDVLWDALSSEEHLHLFANIKGLPPASIKSITEKLLADVKLTGAAKIRAGSYSGGMKRRLSVAIALIGDPKLVFLDEPTTGMDPITRRHVWDIIQESKNGRAIILTTHSMEEADILGDRIGIMAKGRLRCIGTSIRLKSRFGTGFVTTISFLENKNDGPENSHEPLKRFFKEHLKVEPTEETKAFMTFVIPHDKEKLLTRFFRELQDRESEFGISDIQLGLATLEEVFLNIARRAELESATVEGTMVTLELESGISVEIPVGARFVGIPGTENAENPRGIMVEVYWQQDGSGSMCISGHSSEMQVPQNVPVIYEPSSQVLGHGQRRVRGTVIGLRV